MKLKLFLSAFLLALATAVNSQEQTAFSDGDFDYTILPDSVSVSVTALDGTLSGDVVIPASVTYTGKEYAVIRIDDLGINPAVTSVSIPGNISAIGSLSGLTGNRQFYVSDNNATYYSINGMIVSNGSRRLVAYPLSLTEIDIPDGVKEVRHSFSSIVTKVKIPASVTYINGGVTTGVVEVDAANEHYTSVDGALYTKGLDTLLSCPTRGYTYFIPASVKNIASGAVSFSYGNKVVLYSVPPTVSTYTYYSSCICYVKTEDIAAYAEVSPWKSMTIIGYDFISDCTLYRRTTDGEVILVGSYKRAANVIIPSTVSDDEGREYAVTAIGSRAFYNNDNITLLTLPEGIKEIGANAFYGCDGYAEISLPVSLRTIGEYAFGNSSNLRYVHAAGTPPEIALNSFAYGYTKTVYVPSENAALYKAAAVWSNMEIVTEDYVVDEIAFSKTSASTVSVMKYNGTDTAVAIPSVVTIDDKAYSVTAIGSKAFYDNDNLISVQLPEGLEEIGEEAFYYCSKLTEITLPNSLKRIGKSAFSNCYSLISVQLSEGLEEIEERAFYDCYNLSKIALPSSLTTIGNYAFYYCSLRTVELTQEQPISLGGTNAFDSNVRFFVTPASAVSAYKSAAVWRSKNVMGADIWVDGIGYRLLTGNTVSVMACINNYSYGNSSSLNIPERVTLSTGEEYTVTMIADSAFFANVPGELTIPASVKSIGAYALNKNSSYSHTVRMAGTVPPAIETNTFYTYKSYYSSNVSKYARVAVLPSALAGYQDSDYWSTYTILSASDEYDALDDGIGYNIIDGTRKAIVSRVLKVPADGILSIPDTVTINDVSYSVSAISDAAFDSISSADRRVLILPETIDSIGSSSILNRFSVRYLKSPVPPTLREGDSYYDEVFVPAVEAYQTDSRWSYADIMTADSIVIVDSVIYSINNAAMSATLCRWMKTDEYADTIRVPRAVQMNDKEYTVTTLLGRSFQQYRPYVFYIPNTVDSIGDYFLANPRNSNCCMFAERLTPPAIGSSQYSGWKLYVSSTAYNRYANHSTWKRYFSIAALDADDGILLYRKTTTYHETTWEQTAMVIALKDKSARNITVPDTIVIDRRKLRVTEIADRTFSGCSIDTIRLSKNIKTIGASTFSNCTSLTSVQLPDSLEEISEEAFFNCSNLREIKFPSSLRKIGNRAFCNCRLTSLTLPVSVETIGDRAFGYNSGLSQIQVRAGNPSFKASFNNLLSKNGKTLVQATANGVSYTWEYSSEPPYGSRRVSLMRGVEEALPGAFEGISTSYCYLPSTLKHIDGEDLAETSFTQIYVDEDSPYYCDINGVLFTRDTTKIVFFPSSLSNYSSYNGIDYRNYELPSKVDTIGCYAFCSPRFTSLTLSDSLKVIEDYAFFQKSYSNYYPQSLILLSETPPQGSSMAFAYDSQQSADYIYQNTQLYVPMGTYDNYAYTRPWHNFRTISSARIEEEDWQLLKAFKEEMSDGHGWYYTWNLGDDASQMKMLRGMRIKDGHVSSLNMSSYGLSGPLSDKLFRLPCIESLDLSNNYLTGCIDSTLQALPSASATLTVLNLSHNRLEGNIGAVTEAMPNLSTLNISYNKITDILPVLPSSVSSLSYDHQDIAKPLDFMELATQEGDDYRAAIPTLLTYNPYRNDYSRNVKYTATSMGTNQWPLYFTLSDNRLSLTPYNSNYRIYDLPDSTTFTFSDPEMYHTGQLILTFQMGDTDFDGNVNVVDLKRTVDFALDIKPTDLFNKTAADIHADGWVNVQDVVGIVNLLLSQDITDQATAGAKGSVFSISGGDTTIDDSEGESTVRLFWRGSQLVLNSPCDVAAMDIAINGADASHIRWMPRGGDIDYDYAVSQENGYVRIIHYSMSGKNIPAGETVIAEASGAAGILKADMADAHARLMPVKLNDVHQTTGISTITQSELSDGIEILMASPDGIVVSTGSPLTNVKWTVTSLSGKTLATGLQSLPAGQSVLRSNLGSETQVIVSLTAEDKTMQKKISLTK